MHSIIFIARAALALAVFSSGGVGASEDQSELTFAAADGAITALAAAPAAAEIAGFGIPVTSFDLDAYRGGFDLVNNNMQLKGTVANNATVNVLSGNNAIADGSFANASGMPMVIQNSGSNVLIQNATIVNVQFE